MIAAIFLPSLITFQRTLCMKKKKESISVLYRRKKRGHATWVVASFFPFTYRNGIFFFSPYFAVLAMEGTD